jgi:phosphoribosylaminoimidazole carboxylase (NCAIR synthetase)
MARQGHLHGGIPSRRTARESGVSHWVTETDNGICIVEVWESREAFENNADEKGERIVEEVGVPGTPAIEFFEIYNYLPGRSPRA